jgi:type II secretory pathway component PulM
MTSLLYVIEHDFSLSFYETYESLKVSFGDYLLIAEPDVQGGTSAQARWTDRLRKVAAEIRDAAASIVVVAAHQGIFHDYLDAIEESKAEVRVRRAENDLAEELGASAPKLYVTGFHREHDSEIYRILLKPRELAVPGTFARVRALVEEGGGPAGQISVLKHGIMRPFASVRLLLQLDEENGRGGVDPRLVARVDTAIREGRARLAAAARKYEQTSQFTGAVEKTARLFEAEVERITADPRALNDWIDELNAALDCLRQEAR